MTIPTTVIQKNREYVLVKEYDTYVRYKDAITGCMVCFNRHELGLVEEMVKPETNINLIGRRKL
jgi:hypothetical protein